MPKDPAAPNRSTHDHNVSEPGAESQVEPTSGIVTANTSQPSSIAIEIYAVVLFVGIFAYFAVLFLLGGWMVRGVYHLFPTDLTLSMATLAALAAIVFLSFLVLRITVHVIYAMAGLVTQVNDNVPEAEAGIPLDPAEHPQLHRLVSELADQLHAPTPDEIRLTYLAACYTVEIREFGLKTRRRLIMALGMPHISVCSVAELRVIVGHELAHVGRGDTRLTVFIARFLESLNRSIQAMQKHWWRWIDPIYLFQAIYYRIMLRLSAPVQRYQELRADSISAAISGGELASRTLLKDWLLHHQFVTAAASYDPVVEADNGESATDIFTQFASRWHDFSPAGQDYLLGRLAMQENRSFWDPSPTTVERVREMQSYPSVEIPGSDQRARDLLNNYEELAEILHEAMYDDFAGPGIFADSDSGSNDR